jgi:polyferredoxin
MYWYLLLAGVLLPVILNGKSPYCSNVCPLGATQQILVKVGGARVEIPPKYSHCLKLVQWTLAWAAIMCALLLRNPSVMSYEISATFFSVIGRNWQFILLGVVLILSLFVTRPWCNYLCPVRAVADYIRLLRRCFKRQDAS